MGSSRMVGAEQNLPSRDLVIRVEYRRGCEYVIHFPRCPSLPCCSLHGQIRPIHHLCRFSANHEPLRHLLHTIYPSRKCHKCVEGTVYMFNLKNLANPLTPNVITTAAKVRSGLEFCRHRTMDFVAACKNLKKDKPCTIKFVTNASGTVVKVIYERGDDRAENEVAPNARKKGGVEDGGGDLRGGGSLGMEATYGTGKWVVTIAKMEGRVDDDGHGWL
ncbi:hypothetical protein ACSBR2_017937 [Camellia fascicularis]